MSVPELKRCFECGASHPIEVVLCPNDGTPLCFDTVGRRWKIEELIGRRPGGARFSAFHLVNGQRAIVDVLPGENARDATALTHFQQQLQALRMLDLNKGILKLIEEGTEHDGTRFLVTDLGRLRLLPEVLAERRPEWQRPGGAQMDATEAAHLVRPLLSVLSTAGRLGMAHGSLDLGQIYVGSETDFARGFGMLSQVKLHGIVAMGMGQPLREAQAADLRAIAKVLYELCTGKPLPEGEPPVIEPLPESLSGAVGQVVLRAIGVSGPSLFVTAEEMQRALSTAAPSGFTAPISLPPGMLPPSAPVIPPPPLSKPAVVARSLPPPPSAPALPKLGEHASASVATTLPPVRVTTSQPATPTPLSPVAGMPQRSGLTSELRQVSILDLMREMQDQKESAAREETLARSRFRPSSGDIKTIPLDPAAAGLLAPIAPPTGDVAAGPGNEGPTVVDRPPSGMSLEPTVDAHDLPLRPDSARSAKVNFAGAGAAAPAAPSARSGGAAPSAISGHAASPRSAASGRLAPGPAEALSPSASSSPMPSAISATRTPSASSGPMPSAISATRAPSATSGTADSPPNLTSNAVAPAIVIASGAALPRQGGITELEDAPTAPSVPAINVAALSLNVLPSVSAETIAAPVVAPVTAASAAAPEKPPAAAASATGLAPVPRWAWFAIIGPLVAIILGLILKIILS